MNIFILFVSLLLFISTSIIVSAQQVSDKAQSKALICSQKFFDKVENSYNRRRFSSELLGQVERQLNKIVSKCTYPAWHHKAQEYLKIVEEESAKQNFTAARYYWHRFQNGKIKSLGGILSRLKKIIEKYTNYSKIDLVRQVLDEVNKENLKKQKP